MAVKARGEERKKEGRIEEKEDHDHIHIIWMLCFPVGVVIVVVLTSYPFRYFLVVFCDFFFLFDLVLSPRGQ